MKNLFFAPLLLILSVGLNAQISVNDSQIKDLLDPIDSQDAVSKSYLLDQINQLQAQIKYLKKNISVIPANECIDGNAGEYECQGVDLMSSVDLDQLGATMANDCWGWTDTLTGREYAIIGLDNGTAFIDITIPEGAEPGMQLAQTLSNGKTITFTIPEDKKVGDVIQVPLE